MKEVCNFCGNKNFVKKEVEYMYQHDGQMLLIEHVPCEECEYCGERYFEALTLKQIEKEHEEIYHEGKKAKKEIIVPVEEYIKLKK